VLWLARGRQGADGDAEDRKGLPRLPVWEQSVARVLRD